MEKNTESRIYETVLQIVDEETQKLKKPGVTRSFEDLKRLESLTKVYATLKDDVRADMKAGLVNEDDQESDEG